MDIIFYQGQFENAQNEDYNAYDEYEQEANREPPGYGWGRGRGRGGQTAGGFDRMNYPEEANRTSGYAYGLERGRGRRGRGGFNQTPYDEEPGRASGPVYGLERGRGGRGRGRGSFEHTEEEGFGSRSVHGLGRGGIGQVRGRGRGAPSYEYEYAEERREYEEPRQYEESWTSEFAPHGRARGRGFPIPRDQCDPMEQDPYYMRDREPIGRGRGRGLPEVDIDRRAPPYDDPYDRRLGPAYPDRPRYRIHHYFVRYIICFSLKKLLDDVHNFQYYILY